MEGSDHGLLWAGKNSCALSSFCGGAPSHFRKGCRCRSSSEVSQTQPPLQNRPTCLEGPFGEVINSDPGSVSNPFRFSTKYQDTETGLLYYGYRYYAPSTGRWLSRDPMGERGGANLYVHNLNDAVNGVDAVGMMTVKSRCLGKNVEECESICKSQGGVEACFQFTYYSGRPCDTTPSFTIVACACKRPDLKKDMCNWTGKFTKGIGCEYICVDHVTGKGYFKYAPPGPTGCRTRITNP
jgi:RHS repeat-associated protein